MFARHLSLLLALALPHPSVAQERYDLIIRNGRVLDGAGNPWIRADVAIRDGRVVRVGHVAGTATREIDATGRYVSPGWIDMMDQSAPVLARNGLAENKVRMGVTTALSGEGGTPVPASAAAEWFAGLERSGISLNFGTYYSATAARRAVIGMADREPTPAELDRMRAMVDTAMRAGALGVTTALIYPPSSYHRTGELDGVLRIMDSCRIRWARVLERDGDWLAEADLLLSATSWSTTQARMSGLIAELLGERTGSDSSALLVAAE